MLHKTIPSLCILILLCAGCNKQNSITPSRKNITEAVYASGYILSENEYKLYAQSDGYIIEKYVTAGDAIKRGQPLLKIQQESQSAKYDASVEQYHTSLQNYSDKSPVLQDLLLAVKNAELRFSNDSTNFERAKNMFANNAMTKADFDKQTLAFQTSSNDIQSARQKYAKQKDQLRIDLKNAESQLQTSNTDLNNYVLKSIMDGKVYELYKELGETVKKNELIALIGDKSKKIIQLAVDQQDIDKLKIGQEVALKADIKTDKVYPAHITKIYPSMNQSDQSFRVDAEFNNPADFDFIHTSVEANIIISTKQNALVIPKTALKNKDEVDTNSGTVKIKTGIQNMDEIEVLSGLNEHSKVLIPKP